MYARVASFENRDMSRVDELASLARERRSDVPEATGFLMLVDRDAGTALGISFFETEEALRDSEQGFERMAEQVPAELRGKRVSVETFEVVLHEGGSGAKAARVSRLEGPADRIDQAVGQVREQILPRARELDGWTGVVSLVDRSTGAQRLLTLWESTDALRASETQADELRRESAEVGGSRILGVERYEVMVAELPAPTTPGARAAT
jgi:hypothetical protein